jgi:hypothetical protein
MWNSYTTPELYGPGYQKLTSYATKYLPVAQSHARANGIDRYWRLIWRDNHSKTETNKQKQLFVFSKADYLYHMNWLADRGYCVTGDILYTDTTSDNPFAR